MQVSEIIRMVSDEWELVGCEFWKAEYFHHLRAMDELTEEELLSKPYGYWIQPIEAWENEDANTCVILLYYYETEDEKKELSHEKFLWFLDAMDHDLLKILPDIEKCDLSEEQYLESYQKLHLVKYGKPLEMADCVSDYVKNENIQKGMCIMSDASEPGMKRVFLLYNPKSGRETIKSSLSDIVEIFTRAGYEVTARPTLMRGDASSVAETVQDSYDILVCCGGDGTLNETVSGCLRRKNAITIGYIPCGSTNDFGNTIYGPIDKLQAATCILKKQIHMTDCGMLENTAFVYTAAFGLFTDISYETPHSAKATLGHAAYLLEAVKNLGNIKVHKVKAVIDNSETIEGDFLIGMVTNAAYVGGFQNITGKDVSLQDGELELTMIGRPEKPGEYGKVLQALLEGSQNEFVMRRKTKKIHFDFDEPTSFTVDGEYGGTYQTAEIKCMPSAFPLIY